MRIGIITFWSSSNNYGQLLQCWALQHYLHQNGHQAYLIAYSPKYSFFKKISKLTPGKVFRRLSKSRKLEQTRSERLATLDEARDFDGFRLAHICRTSSEFSNLSELRANPPIADVYIAGSDQIWNGPLADKDNHAYYLDFGTATKIAYAASISRKIEPREVNDFARLLQNFKAVSVRERSSAKECSRYGIHADVCVDPTLLLSSDEYEKLISDSVDGCTSSAGNRMPYMFLYIVNVESEKDFPCEEVYNYCELSSLAPRVSYASGYMKPSEFLTRAETVYPTVPDWLKELRDSDCVVTSSFHGVVFCILFQKPFLAIPLAGQNEEANSRIRDLLESLGLQNRVYDPIEPFRKQMDSEIQWLHVEQRLIRLRSASIDYLAKALNNNL